MTFFIKSDEIFFLNTLYLIYPTIGHPLWASRNNKNTNEKDTKQFI